MILLCYVAIAHFRKVASILGKLSKGQRLKHIRHKNIFLMITYGSLYYHFLYSGEATRKASKTLAKEQKDVFDTSIPLNRGFGSRIDFIIFKKKI